MYKFTVVKNTFKKVFEKYSKHILKLLGRILIDYFFSNVFEPSCTKVLLKKGQIHQTKFILNSRVNCHQFVTISTMNSECSRTFYHFRTVADGLVIIRGVVLSLRRLNAQSLKSESILVYGYHRD